MPLIHVTEPRHILLTTTGAQILVFLKLAAKPKIPVSAITLLCTTYLNTWLIRAARGRSGPTLGTMNLTFKSMCLISSKAYKNGYSTGITMRQCFLSYALAAGDKVEESLLVIAYKRLLNTARRRTPIYWKKRTSTTKRLLKQWRRP